MNHKISVHSESVNEGIDKMCDQIPRRDLVHDKEDKSAGLLRKAITGCAHLWRSTTQTMWISTVVREVVNDRYDAEKLRWQKHAVFWLPGHHADIASVTETKNKPYFSEAILLRAGRQG